MTPVGPASPAHPPAVKASQSVSPVDAKLHTAAKQFEAMFMTEMMHHARPTPSAQGVFAAGAGEKAWQVLMDQALGQAASAQSGSDLTSEIEKALKAAQGHHVSRSKR